MFRFARLAGFACLALGWAGPGIAQTAAKTSAKTAAETATAYVAPKNSLGQPDLNGLWTNATVTQLERDPRFGDRLAMTAEEAGARGGGEPGSRIMDIDGQPRTSFMVAPADGRLPALTAEAYRAHKTRLAAMPHGAGYARGDNPESLTLGERCIKDFGSSSGPPMMPLGYNNTYQIVQSPTDVMILVEMVHDARIVRLTRDGRRPSAIRQYMGDSIGWYEGDTLVVETTSFRPGQAFRGGPQDMKVVERFRRVNDSQILYSFDINDPNVFAAPIKAELAMNATDGPLFEYACHEGNYGMAGILSGYREQDRRVAEQLAKARKPALGRN